MVEIIGFIISLLALLYLFIKQNVPSLQKGHPPPPAYQDEEEMSDPFKEFLRAMEKESAAREAVQHMPPPPPPKKKGRSKQTHTRPSENYRLTSPLEERHLKSALEDRHVKSRFNHHEDLPGRTLSLSLRHPDEREEKPRASRLQSIVNRLARRQDIIIYQEIIGKPKSLRSEDYPA
jgi:hypothetical protein